MKWKEDYARFSIIMSIIVLALIIAGAYADGIVNAGTNATDDQYSWETIGHYGWEAHDGWALRWANRSISHLEFSLYIIDYEFSDDTTAIENMAFYNTAICGALYDKLGTPATMRLRTRNVDVTTDFEHLDCRLVVYEMVMRVHWYQLFGHQVQKFNFDIQKTIST